VWAKTGQEPLALQNQPEVPAWLAEYCKAFRILSSRRPKSGEGIIQPIPFTDITDYIKVFEVEDEETFISHIVGMDTAITDHVMKLHSQKPKTPAPAKATKPHRGR
jgi:hypothetical protein